MKVTIEAQGATGSAPTGIPQYTINLIRALVETNVHDYSLSFFDYNRACGNRAAIDRVFGDLNLKLYECNNIHYGYLSDKRAYQNKSYNDYTGSNSDVFHFPHVINIPNVLNGKMVVTCHDLTPILPFYDVLPFSKFQLSFSIGLERMYRMRPTIITGSFSAKEDIVKYTGLPEESIHVVYHGINRDVLFPEKNKTALKRLGVRTPYYLTLCILDEYRKNVRKLLAAFEMVAEKDADVQLVLAGSYSSQDFKAFIDNSRFRDRIVLTGYITDDERRALLSDALAMVYPSLYEGFGLPIIEAMACGAPVITSNVSSMPEAAGDASILIDPNDTEQLAFEMQRVLDSAELRAEMIKKGFEHSAKFTWEKAAEETERVYQLAMDS